MTLNFATGAALAAATALFAMPAEAKVARCVIKSPAGYSSGPCSYTPRANGSFTLEPMRRRYLVGKIMTVRLDVSRPGIGRVSALSGYGTVSRWGNAWRSTRDRACWMGRDLSVCAY